MMLEWTLTPNDVARIRFAFSPLWELVASLRTIRDPARQAVHLPWIKAVSPRLRHLELTELFALIPVTGYFPDFLTPPPETPLPDFRVELERLRSTAPTIARLEVGLVATTAPAAVEAFQSDAEQGIARLADTLERYWNDCFAEFWPRVRGLLEADMLRRSRTLISGGAEMLFASLNPTITWQHDRVLIEKPGCAVGGPDGDGLLLVPSAFHWPTIAVVSEPHQSMLIYPAGGVGTLWEQGPAPAPDALAALIGRTRAQVLIAIAEPATTTALATRMSLTTGAISQHLGALSGGGLARGERVGKEVYYRRTAIGDALATGPVHAVG